MIRCAAFIACLATAAPAAEFEFCWEGANGYRMEGWMSVPDETLSNSLVTHSDVDGFFIQGFHDDVSIGAWDLSQLTVFTSWNLSFDPRGMVFPTGGTVSYTHLTLPTTPYV